MRPTRRARPPTLPARHTLLAEPPGPAPVGAHDDPSVLVPTVVPLNVTAKNLPSYETDRSIVLCVCRSSAPVCAATSEKPAPATARAAAPSLALKPDSCGRGGFAGADEAFASAAPPWRLVRGQERRARPPRSARLRPGRCRWYRRELATAARYARVLPRSGRPFAEARSASPIGAGSRSMDMSKKNTSPSSWRGVIGAQIEHVPYLQRCILVPRTLPQAFAAGS
jgi:hypothetical protein